MERESFIFYRSFYEAVRDLPKDIKVEVLAAIIEYALYGRQPDALNPFANSIFTLVRPTIDANNARFLNGKQGARFGRRGGRPPKAKPAPDTPTAPQEPASVPQAKKATSAKKATQATQATLTYDQEVARIRSDADTIALFCADFKITPDEFDTRLTRFLRHCTDDGERRGRTAHKSYTDAIDHLRYWMSKAFPAAAAASTSPSASNHPTTPSTAELDRRARAADAADYQQLLQETGADNGYQVYLRQRGLDLDTPVTDLLNTDTD